MKRRCSRQKKSPAAMAGLSVVRSGLTLAALLATLTGAFLLLLLTGFLLTGLLIAALLLLTRLLVRILVHRRWSFRRFLEELSSSSPAPLT